MNIVERVARAIAESNGVNPDSHGENFLNDPYPAWVDFEGYAQSVIKASGVKELVEALEPFARLADTVEKTEHLPNQTVMTLVGADGVLFRVTAGDLYAARAALRKAGVEV